MNDANETGRAHQNHGSSPVEQVKTYIVEHRLVPGDPLPTESELGAQLGVSRSRMRETMKSLQALDLVEVRHGYGTFVGQMRMTALVESLVFRSVLETPGERHVLDELVEVRELLERSLADLLVAKASSGSRGELCRLAEAMAAKASADEDFLDEDRRFHEVLAEITGNSLAKQLTSAFWEVNAAALVTLHPYADRAASAAHHADIVAAIDLGDAEALRSAIVRHYEPVRARMALAIEG